jgi:hypothetical protein
MRASTRDPTIVYHSSHVIQRRFDRRISRFFGKSSNSAETSSPLLASRTAKTAQALLLVSLLSMTPSHRYPSLIRLCTRQACGQSCQPKTLTLSPSLLIYRPSSEHYRLTMPLFKPHSLINQRPRQRPIKMPRSPNSRLNSKNWSAAQLYQKQISADSTYEKWRN